MEETVKREFEVGQKVEWTRVSGNKNHINFTVTTGYIHEIKGDIARCRCGKKGKKDHWVHLGKLGLPRDGRGTKVIRDVIETMTGKGLNLGGEQKD